MNLETVETLMREIGPACDAVLAVVREDESSWLLGFESDIAVEIAYDADQQKLNLLSELGAPLEETRQSLYETMLIYNSLSTQTGGLYLGLDGQQGNPVLMFNLNATELDLGSLESVVLQFVERVVYWMAAIQSETGAEGGEREGIPAMGHDDHAAGIRV